MQKKLYAFQVPQGGRTHIELCAFLLEEISGFNVRTLNGHWHSDKTGQAYVEPMFEYQVMCDAGMIPIIRDKVMALWPKEEAFFFAEIGRAQIVYREPAKVVAE